MGGCCSRGDVRNGGVALREEDGDDGDFLEDEGSGSVRLGGSCKFVSMYSQQGWKGVNQDAMTIWKVIHALYGLIFVYIYIYIYTTMYVVFGLMLNLIVL